MSVLPLNFLQHYRPLPPTYIFGENFLNPLPWITCVASQTQVVVNVSFQSASSPQNIIKIKLFLQFVYIVQ